MRKLKLIFISLIFIIGSILVQAQQNRIDYNGQKLFLSGSNLAWVIYGNDIGLGTTDTTTIANWMIQMHQHGGNSMRWWLHTNGTASPVFNSNNIVTGPGTTIAEIKKVLDLAWDREIGIDLCLWSFGMLDGGLSTGVINRNYLLLTDTSYTNAYIRNCLTPMVEALKGHPAIITWEIFNEPEGMSSEYGWTTGGRVPMSTIQRFINLCAGAIHRADPNAKVTNGAQTLGTLTDVLAKRPAGVGLNLTTMSESEKKSLENWFNSKYRAALTAEQIVPIIQKLATANHNYYSDDRLITAGGDQQGILDFYSVHYYSQNGSSVSPILYPASHWNLTKPTVVAEFAVQNTDGVQKELVYEVLYQNGYAGSLAWSWTDVNLSSHADMLAGMQSLWDKHRPDVDLLGTGADWPTISITSPQDGATFPEGSQVLIEVAANDQGTNITSVEFFVSDNIKIGEVTIAPYTFTWTNIIPGIYRLTAVATNSFGHKQISNSIQITVGTPQMTRFEAETASLQGGNMTVKNDPAASGGKYVDIATQDPNFMIVWQVNNVQAAGSYEIAFGYKLAYNTPKSQYINVNGVRATELVFDGSVNVWLEKKLTVNLVQGTNTIQMQLSWGWMYLDYLAVPTNIISDVKDIVKIPTNYSLEQNYPNPFNPETVISYQLPVNSLVVLKIYDLLGREVATLVNETQTAGIHHSTFNSLNYSLSSGVYFYTLKAGDFVESKKMILLK